MRTLLACTAIALALGCRSGGQAEGMTAGAQPETLDAHPFSIHDMLAMQRVAGAQVSPDGQWVVFALRTTDVEANRGTTDLWLAAVDGTSVRQLTSASGSEFEPRWMPDGTAVAYLGTRSGSVQVWRVDVQDGATQRLSDFPVDVTGMHVFPDGRRFALSMEVYPDASSLAETAARDNAPEPASSAMVFESLLYRHWDTWEDGKRAHVFVWDSAGAAAPVDLMRGMDADCPTRPFGGSEDFAVSPDGASVVMAFKDDGQRAAWTTNVDLWLAPADGTAVARRLTAVNEALDGNPVFAPDGSVLAHLAMSRPGYEADKLDIVLLDVNTGVREVITAGWDRSAGEITWSPDGHTIYTSANDLGNRSIFAIDVGTREVKRLMPTGTNRGVMVAGERLVFSHDDLASPAELWSMELDGTDLLPVTSVNARRVAAARTGDYEQFTFPGAGGHTVRGWVVKPVGFEPGRKYPVAFLIHGGPQGSFGNHFHYRWNPQAYAGAGYAAVFIDFHGSTGYGQEFTDAINQQWGGKPYEDLMLGLDHALHVYPFLDGDRVAALGASYGGYMINWIAGQTDRFRCLVNHDGVFDTRSMYFATEEQWFPEWDFGGTPWTNPEGYAQWNPVEHVGKWKTPMLVVQGALDFRVVETQAFAAFTALQRQGVPSRLLYFPDENHWVLKPRNSIRWHEEVLSWLDRWTAVEPAG